MALLADESVDFEIISDLRLKGIVVISVLEDYTGIKDTQVLKLAHDNQYLLVTEDKDFGELAYRFKLKHCGIMLIRLTDIPRMERIQLASETIEKYFDKMTDNFSVLTSKGLRIKTAQQL